MPTGKGGTQYSLKSKYSTLYPCHSVVQWWRYEFMGISKIITVVI